MAEPIVIFRTQSDIEASIVHGLLETHGIISLLSSDVPHSILPLSVNGLGEVRISVRLDQADEARRIIASHQAEGLSAAQDEPEDLDALEEALGYQFRDREFLEHALTHSSRAHEDPTAGAVDNESLEFLGDAIIGFVVAALLYEEFPASDEGEKSKMKGALVSTTSLARLGERLQLGRGVRLGRGEDKTGGRQKPTLLADTFEAVVAAVYLDGGVDAVRACLHRHLRDLVDEVRTTGVATIAADYKSKLQEWLQSHEHPLPSYRVIGESGPDHRKTFRVEVVVRERGLAQAEGRSKKDAEQQAARLALDHLRSDGQPSC